VSYARPVGKATILLLLAGEEVWKPSEWVPGLGDNLGRLGYPQWYVFKMTEHSGRIAHDCRLEAARPPVVEPTDTGPDDEGLLTAQ
jgi:hypothetical protein